MNERTAVLLERSDALDLPGAVSRRREDLVERAIAVGHTREYADLIYDVATEVNLDAALAFELVLTGVGVRDLAPAPPDYWEETQVGAPPAWVAGQGATPDDAARERRVRTTFRRMRSLLEVCGTVREAVSAFVREADVGDVAY